MPIHPPLESAANIFDRFADGDRQRSAELAAANAEINRLRANIGALLKRCGMPPRACRGCGAQIVFVVSMNGLTSAPYDLDGTPHFAVCPNAGEFRRGKK